ncbi:hypothetical protein VMCG_09390 [Cytospora schulzeri]|uniref:Uncharacterized protein n=1 Tax=Cytospora schulzeri TaxID=448051 RepID=A0A423VIE7_9PEZI|nr:hypothetical protein VMCG_09390 [Valsa malicola]
MVDITEICPDGSTVTTTATETYEVMTRSICHTSAPSLPCYVCEFGLPTGDHLMTIATTSNSASPAPTPDVTVQMCSTCQTSVLSIAVRGYVPGTACHNCQPSASGTAAATATAMATALAIQEHDVEAVSRTVGNTPFAPPAPTASASTAAAAYVTAGTTRNVAHGGLVAFFLGLFLVVW